MQLKQACDNLHVRWGPDKLERKKRIHTILETDRKRAEHVLKGVRLDTNGDLTEVKDMDAKEVTAKAVEMLDKYLKSVEISSDKIKMLMTNMTIHETSARP